MCEKIPVLRNAGISFVSREAGEDRKAESREEIE